MRSVLRPACRALDKQAEGESRPLVVFATTEVSKQSGATLHLRDIVREAMHRLSFQNARAVKNFLWALGEDEARFARKGRTQQWVSRFTEQDLAYYYELVEKYKVDIYVDAKA